MPWNAPGPSSPPWCRAEAPTPPSRSGALCHGDFHLGQLVRLPGPSAPPPSAQRPPTGDEAWRLIDVDDLGLGDPAWDLARPAAWFATGVLPPESWTAFLAAYRAGGGPAAPDPDPWPRLDAPARTLTVQTAALAVARAHRQRRALDEAERACLAGCARIAALGDPTPVPPGAVG